MIAVLISARELVDRFRHRRQRAEDFAALARTLERVPDAKHAAPELVALANELAELRERLVQALGAVESCKSCAVGHPLPFGRWDGGHCCGGRTEQLFTEDELAALKLSGTSLSRMSAPSSDLAGCAFRGPAGCSLEPRDRPNLCVRYLCRDLERELRQRGDKPEIVAIADRLGESFQRFVAARRRLAQESAFEELVRGKAEQRAAY